MKRIAIILGLLLGGVAAHAQAPQFTCSNAKNYESHVAMPAGNTQLVLPPVAGGAPNIYICSYSVQVTQGSTPAYFALSEGLGAACSTNTAYRTLWATGAASSYPSIGATFTSDSALRLTQYNGLCFYGSAAFTNVSIQIRYVLGL